MKKVFLALSVTLIMVSTSCKKTESGGNNGTWTFKGTTYSPTTSVNGTTSIGGVNVGTPGGGVMANAGSDELTVAFNPLLTASNSDITLASGNVSVVVTAGGITYKGITNGAVSETYSSGNVTVSSVGAGIIVYNTSNNADSSILIISGVN
jgi:type 1 fimbria pilin